MVSFIQVDHDPFAGEEAGYFPQRPDGESAQPSLLGRVTEAIHNLRTSMPNANPGMNPDAIDAERAAQAARPLGDVASDAMQTAVSGANPLTSIALHGAQAVGNALAPTPVASGELPKSLQGPMAPGAQPLPATELEQVQAQIDKLRRDRAAAVDSVKKTKTVTGTGDSRSIVWKPDPNEMATKVAPFDSAISNAEGRLDAINKANAPFAQTASPELKRNLAWAPALSGLGGAVGGFLKNTPATYALSGAFGGLEGATGAALPTLMDLRLPEGSPGLLAARQRIRDPDFWMEQVAPEAGLGVAGGLAGTYYGGRARGVVNAVGSGLAKAYGALRGGAAQAPNALPAGNAIAPATPASVWTGKEKLTKDASGKWRDDRGYWAPKHMWPEE